MRIELRVIVNGTVINLTPDDARELCEQLSAALYRGVATLSPVAKPPVIKTKK